MNKIIKTIILITLFIFFILSFILFPYNIFEGLSFGNYYLKIDNYDKLGEFVGGITAPLLSISAFILLYLTYKSQREELKENRIIQEKQRETLEKQQFETTFFNMLDLQNRIVESIDLKTINKKSSTDGIKSQPPRELTQGRDCFVKFYKGYRNSYYLTKRKNLNAKIKEEEIIIDSFLIYYKKHQSDLGHYFRTLYHIFKFIKESSIKNKYEYTSLVRAQLSSHELLMLFYNGLSCYGKKFKFLVEEFQILKSVPEEDLILIEHLDLYQETAFKRKVTTNKEF